jgi:hypothetical protein
MTEMLEEAIEKIRKLPKADQILWGGGRSGG